MHVIFQFEHFPTMNIDLCVENVTLLCVCGWKGLPPSVKKPHDNQKSPPCPNQGTEGDATVTKTGTAAPAEWALMYCISENGAVFMLFLKWTTSVSTLLCSTLCTYLCSV